MKQSSDKKQTDEKGRRAEIASSLDNLEWITLDDLTLVVGGTAGAEQSAM
jgi:hypothetical protein